MKVRVYVMGIKLIDVIKMAREDEVSDEDINLDK